MAEREIIDESKWRGWRRKFPRLWLITRECRQPVKFWSENFLFRLLRRVPGNSFRNQKATRMLWWDAISLFTVIIRRWVNFGELSLGCVMWKCDEEPEGRSWFRRAKQLCWRLSLAALSAILTEARALFVVSTKFAVIKGNRVAFWRLINKISINFTLKLISRAITSPPTQHFARLNR